MPLLKTPHDFQYHDVELRIWHFTESLESLEQQFPLAADEAKHRIASSASVSRRAEMLLSSVLLHEALGKDVSLTHLPSGKPVARGSKRHISISHTRGYVALSSSSKPHGIDLEQWSPRVLKLSKKFLTPEELPLLGDSPEEKAVFLWAAKEAAFKLWDAADTTIHKDIQLSQTEEGRLIATHTRQALSADIQLYAFPFAAFALATLPTAGTLASHQRIQTKDKI